VSRLIVEVGRRTDPFMSTSLHCYIVSSLHRCIVACLIYQAESQLLQRIICFIAAVFFSLLLVALTKDLIKRSLRIQILWVSYSALVWSNQCGEFCYRLYPRGFRHVGFLSSIASAGELGPKTRSSQFPLPRRETFAR
jgi:hypothetical protein